MSKYRTHTCGELTVDNEDSKVTLCGWVNARRDLGGLIFIDLRDRYGLTQITFNPEDKKAFKLAEKSRPEYILQVTGVVKKRPRKMVNPKIKTGEIEILVKEAKIINESKTPPFEINTSSHVDEDLRLKYRYLDLRRNKTRYYLQKRLKFINLTRQYFNRQGFWDIETPIFTKATPEGARDFVVPTTSYPGKFYALPQSPQQYKQLLMCAGVDKYFQIARCFRDEALRSDRTQEFSQLDIEMSFVTEDDVINLVEDYLMEICPKLTSRKITTKAPFPRLTHKEAMSKYGSDKPDLRFNLEIENLTNVFSNTKIQIFSKIIKNKGTIQAIHIPSGKKSISRSDIDKLTEQASDLGAGGLAYIYYNSDNTITSPLQKFIKPDEISGIKENTNAKAGDLVIIIADQTPIALKVLGELRLTLGEKLGLINDEELNFVWITDFPMFTIDDETGKISADHNPFSGIKPEHEDWLDQDNKIFDIIATQYDLALNGNEIFGGSIRNHKPELLQKVFSIIGLSKNQINEQFGHMIDAFDYGTPPHGGIAASDRFLYILLNAPSIREVIPFPTNSKGITSVMNAPTLLSKEQLHELHLNIDKPKK